MKDIFDARILCKECSVEMKPEETYKSGIKIRTVNCPKCKEKIFHPEDLNKLKKYNDLKGKTYNVKLRMVGNSHAISIPKEIVDFINGANRKIHKEMNDMVRLAFEDFGKISLDFINHNPRGRRGW
jgi:Zn-finger nucleic acid-binding protein